MNALPPTLADSLADEILSQLRLHESLWPLYDEEENTLAPHRQRTATNRLTGYALFLQIPFGKEAGPRHPLRILRRWQKLIGGLRDLDVLRDHLRELGRSAGPESIAAVELLVSELTERRREILGMVRIEARSLTGARTRHALREVEVLYEDALTRLRERPEDFDAALALDRVETPWREALHGLADAMTDEALHAFRVRNKRLRFVVDIICMAPPESMDRKRLKKRASTLAGVHTTLGNLSDLGVLDQALRQARARWSTTRQTGDPVLQGAALLEQARSARFAEELNSWFHLYPELWHTGEG